MRANRNEVAVQEFAARTPGAVEPNVWSTDPDDVVLTFRVDAPPQALTKKDFGAIEFLEVVRQTQHHWVLPGTRAERRLAPWLTNNVSNTVTVQEHEWDAVARFLFDHRDDFTGVALLPASGDKDYPQAPMCAVPTYREITARYGEVDSVVTPLLQNALRAFDGNFWSVCDALLRVRGAESGAGPADSWVAASRPNARRQDEALVCQQRIAWTREASRMATRLFGGDVRRMCHCLQDVYQHQLWLDLGAAYEGFHGSQVVGNVREARVPAKATQMAQVCAA
jgi:ribonucleoside-diphosphate reductase alpha chain